MNSFISSGAKEPASTDDVLFQTHQAVAQATLNRPQALNALNIGIFKALRRQMRLWLADPSIALMVIRGAGAKAFCAGGDVKSLAIELRNRRAVGDFSDSYAHEFFFEEYSLDYLIHSCQKPVVVIAHGITMGGGIGLLAGAAIRILTSDSILAMPEISIGYFTDVGSSYFLNRMPGKSGLFCAVTAARMTASDAVYLGLADLVVSPDQVAPLTAWLEQQAPYLLQDRAELLKSIQDRFGIEPRALPLSLFQRFQSQINTACEGNTILEVAQNLKNFEANRHPDMPWGLDPFWQGSPTSASVIFEQLKRTRGLTARECFDLEINMALHFCRGLDFVEGVRALLIDKDKKPKWKPTRLDLVNSNEVESYFAGSYRIEVEA